jgi:prolyl-tRNA synthetase
MTHGDDDGLRTPPTLAPKQIVLIPILRDKPEDGQVIAYAQSLAADLRALTVFGQPVRAHVDQKPGKSADKRWDWVRRGAPLILEIGPRDAANGQVSFMRRDALREGDKLKSHSMGRDEFAAGAPTLLIDIQRAVFEEAHARLHGNIRTDIKTYDELAAYFGSDEDGGGFKGWVRAPWSRPSGAGLDAVVEKLKALKLTIRNAPMDQPATFGPCLFTGEPGVEEILIARAY